MTHSFLLLTRPLEDSLEMEKNLSIPVVKAPLLHIDPLPIPPSFSVATYTNLIITSYRSLSLFPSLSEFFEKPLWCVGHKTAFRARSMGFKVIHTANNSAEELYQLILKQQKKGEKFLHLCGETLHYDIVHHLQNQGYHADKCIVYKTTPIDSFSKDVLDLFEAKKISMIPIFSKKTAETLGEIIRTHKLEKSLRMTTLVACSSSSIEPLTALKWQKITIKPDLSPMVLESLYHKKESIRKRKEILKKNKWALAWGGGLIIFFLIYRINTPYFSSPDVSERGKLKEIITSSPEKSQSQLSEQKLGFLADQVKTLKQEVEQLAQFKGDIKNMSFLVSLKMLVLIEEVENQLQGEEGIPVWEKVRDLLKNRGDIDQNLLPTVLPPSKKQLLQEIKMREEEKQGNAKEQESFYHPFLKKAEKYIGSIFIYKDSPLSSTKHLKDEDVLNAIETENLTQIKLLINQPEIDEHIKQVLLRAEDLFSFHNTLKKIKSLLRLSCVE